jgi:hypothetical protein
MSRRDGTGAKVGKESGADGRIGAAMALEAQRTLVKSPPELWGLVDQPERMEGLMSALLGEAAEIEVVKRDPEQFLAWKGAVEDETALESLAAVEGVAAVEQAQEFQLPPPDSPIQ